MRDEMPPVMFLAVLVVLAVVIVSMAVRAGDHVRVARWLGFTGGDRGQE